MILRRKIIDFMSVALGFLIGLAMIIIGRAMGRRIIVVLSIVAVVAAGFFLVSIIF